MITIIGIITDIVLIIFIWRFIRELKHKYYDVTNVYIEIMRIYGEIKAIEIKKGSNKEKAKKELKKVLNAK